MTDESIAKPARVGFAIGHVQGNVRVLERKGMGPTQDSRSYRVEYLVCGCRGVLTEEQIRQRADHNAQRCAKCVSRRCGHEGKSYAHEWGTSGDARARVSFGGGSSDRVVEAVIAGLGGAA